MQVIIYQQTNRLGDILLVHGTCYDGSECAMTHFNSALLLALGAIGEGMEVQEQSLNTFNK